MPIDLRSFHENDIDPAYIEHLLHTAADHRERAYARLWNYFRNPLVPATGLTSGALNENSRPYFLAQEAGLPPRITGVQRSRNGEQVADLRRKEVVIENDIAWRIQTMVDFLFGRTVTFRSRCRTPEKAHAIETVLHALIEGNGGIRFLQEAAIFASVYGSVDLALRLADPPTETQQNQATGERDDAAISGRSLSRALRLTRRLRVETIEASRVLPVLAEDDYTRTRLWIQRYHKHPPRLAGARRRLPLSLLGGGERRPASVEVVEILSDNWWQRYEDRRLIAEGENLFGFLPVIHIQNVPTPGRYDGVSDVEPLIPLQDELNTRLSDRAHRVTYQSFRMYLGKGIDDFLERPVGPGQMWATQNPQASIEEFGSDEGSPSEDAHITQVREAMDKVSGVSPLATGLVRGNLGNLTSAAALRVVLRGLLARTERKRQTFGAGLAALAEHTLDWLHRSGALATEVEDRRVDVHWPDPLPDNEGERLRNAVTKRSLGVPAERVLAELGYEGDMNLHTTDTVPTEEQPDA